MINIRCEETNVLNHQEVFCHQFLIYLIACQLDKLQIQVVSEMTTESCVDDGKAFPNVISQVFGYPKIVIGDGAYDDREIRKLIRKKGGKALVLTPSNAVSRGIDPDGDGAILDIRALEEIRKQNRLSNFLNSKRLVFASTEFFNTAVFFGDYF